MTTRFGAVATSVIMPLINAAMLRGIIKRLGAVPWSIARHYVDEAVTVSDDDIRAAQRELWLAFRLVVEPGGAAALAAIRSGVYVPSAGERVVVVVCGANCDPATVVGNGDPARSG